MSACAAQHFRACWRTSRPLRTADQRDPSRCSSVTHCDVTGTRYANENQLQAKLYELVRTCLDDASFAPDWEAPSFAAGDGRLSGKCIFGRRRPRKRKLVHMAPRTSARRSPDDSSAPRRIGRRRDVDRAADAEETRENILNVATREFAEKGLSGARIDEIAELTRTSKRMIYYYFGSKEGLYLAVLEEAYRRTREVESQLHLEDLEPEGALRRLVAFTFDHHLNHENYIRLVMSENINRGQFLAQSQRIQDLNVPAIAAWFFWNASIAASRYGGTAPCICPP